MKTGKIRITLLVAALLLGLTTANAQKGLYGNRYLKDESKTTHTFQLNVGLNLIDNNHWTLYGDVVGLPFGFSYQFCKNNFWYLKLKYTNFGMKSGEQDGIMTYENMQNVIYHTSGSLSQHLVALSFGLTNDIGKNGNFYAGLALGYLLNNESNDVTIYYYEGTEQKQMVQSYDNGSNNIYIGVEAAYRYYLSNNLFIGAEGNVGYLTDNVDDKSIDSKFCYSLSGVIGWTFTKKKNYRF